MSQLPALPCGSPYATARTSAASNCERSSLTRSRKTLPARQSRASLLNGRLDVVMHSPRHMVVGPTEAFAPEQHAQIHDIDVLGTQRANARHYRSCASKAVA